MNPISDLVYSQIIIINRVVFTGLSITSDASQSTASAMRGSTPDGNAYHAAYKSYSTLEGATYHHSPTLPADGGVKANGLCNSVQMRHNGNQGMAGVVASYGVYQQDEPDDDDDHGFANANFHGNAGRGMVVNAGGAAVVVDQRHCPANTPAATTTNSEGWMTCCRPIVLLLTLVLLIIVFVFVSGVLLYINCKYYRISLSLF